MICWLRAIGITSPPEVDQREAITPPHSSPYLRGGWVGLKEGTRLPSVGQGFYDICVLTCDIVSNIEDSIQSLIRNILVNRSLNVTVNSHE